MSSYSSSKMSPTIFFTMPCVEWWKGQGVSRSINQPPHIFSNKNTGQYIYIYIYLYIYPGLSMHLRTTSVRRFLSYSEAIPALVTLRRYAAYTCK